MAKLRLFTSVAVLLIAACGGDTSDTTTTVIDSTTTTEGTTTTDATTTTTTTEGTTTTDGTTTTTTADAGTDPVVSDGFPGTGMPAFLTDATVEQAEGTVEIRFIFEGGEAGPEYRVEYVEPPILESPSGLETEVAGDAFLSVTMAPAGGVDLSGDTPRETYTGPEEMQPENAGPVLEIQNTEDFEAVMSWVIGLESELPFEVRTADGSLTVAIHTS